MARRGENIYKRKDGRWEGRYIRGHRANGTTHYGYVYGKSYTEVKEKVLPLKVKALETRKENGHCSEFAPLWLLHWLAYVVQPRVKVSTLASYQYKLTRYVFPYLEQVPLNDLTSSLLQEMVQAWQSEKHLASSTCHLIFRLLNQALDEAVQQGALTENPCDKVVLPKKSPTKVHALTKEEQTKLETVAHQEKYGFSVLLALRTGLRIGEIAALTWQDVDFHQKTLTVRRTYQRVLTVHSESRTQLVLADAKTIASKRVIPLSDALLCLLRNWQKTHSGTFLLEFQGKPLEPRVLTYHFHTLLKKAGIFGVHFHQLRHTFARRCLESTSDIASISAILGHTSTKTTLDTYMDSYLEQRRLVMNQLEQRLIS